MPSPFLLSREPALKANGLPLSIDLLVPKDKTANPSSETGVEGKHRRQGLDLEDPVGGVGIDPVQQLV